MAAGKAADPATDNLRLDVKKGDRIGFGVTTGVDDAGATVHWATSFDYGDGDKYVSSEDTELAQGPIWSYCIYAPGTGCMDLLGEVLQPAAPGQDKSRVPSGFRAPAECSSLGATTFRLVNAYELVRVWTAPKDGAVIISGIAEHAGGADAVASVYRIADRGSQPIARSDARAPWTRSDPLR